MVTDRDPCPVEEGDRDGGEESSRGTQPRLALSDRRRRRAGARVLQEGVRRRRAVPAHGADREGRPRRGRSEEHTSELQSRPHLVCRLLLEKKKRARTAMNQSTMGGW